MAKNIMIVGYGPGTATAVAEKFGKNGFSVAIVGREPARLAEGVAALKAQGVDAQPFVGDASDSASIRAAVRDVKSKLGPISVLHWNAYGGTDVPDLLGADQAALHRVFDIAVFGLIAAAEEALPDLKADGKGAILISNGALGVVAPESDVPAVKYHFMGLALSSAAKHKLVGLLSERLKDEGVYVGEVLVYRTIKGTPGADGNPVDPSDIAEKHWENYQARGETRAVVK